MQTITTIKDIREIVKKHHANGKTVGLIPTMGNLHAGHISLVEQMQKTADITITSIFVNPLQFGKDEDLDGYPKTLKADQQNLKTANCDYIFAPTTAEIYPDNNKSKTQISVPALDNILCGKSRPGHLTGVATIVAKLFNIVAPNYAIFGIKDYQQLQTIKQMTTDLCHPITILSAPIVRDKHGLALSSRNNFLTDVELKIAPRLNQILNIIKQSILDGETNFLEIEKQANQIINESGFKADYFEIRTQTTLKHAQPKDKTLIILTAAHIGTTRLIDNIMFDIP